MAGKLTNQNRDKQSFKKKKSHYDDSQTHVSGKNKSNEENQASYSKYSPY